jgi:hypothetical protein
LSLGRARLRPNRAARVIRAQRSTPGVIENDDNDEDEDDCSKHRRTLKCSVDAMVFVRLPDMRQPDI